MKIFLLVIPLFLLSGQLCYASSPCDSLMCMAGKAGIGSSGGSSCSGPINDFFNIVKHHHHGGINFSGTSDARKEFLMGCSGASANTQIIDTIIEQFGRKIL